MKYWYVRYGCEFHSEDCVVICDNEEQVKEWAIQESHYCYDSYNRDNFKDNHEEEQWEEDHRFWFVEPFSPYDDTHMEAYYNQKITTL